MIPKEFEPILFNFISKTIKRPIRDADDLINLPSTTLLKLLSRVNDDCVYAIVCVLKSSRRGTEAFHNLMGEHEVENRTLVDSFFNRYMNIVLSHDEELKYYNPLTLYLPPSTFADLAFVQSRQAFFLRQTITTINEYLAEVFPSSSEFAVDEQDKAWQYFWQQICQL